MEIREALDAAFEKAEAPATDTTPAPAPEAQATTAAPVAAVPAPESAPSVPTEGRDEKGRFAKSAKKAAAPPAPGETTGTPPPAAEAATETPAPPPAETTPSLKAPSSWKPLAREKWSSLPPETQAEVWRREKEVAHVLQETAAARKAAEAFDATVRPYLPLIQAEGGDPLKAVGSLLQTAAALRTAPPAHKAQLVASLIKTYGVPIEALDAALAGEAPAHQPGPAEYRDPRVDTLLAQLQAQKQQLAQSVSQKAASAIEEFQKEAEFLDDVRDDMADLIEVASRRGVELSLKDAYSRAVAMHPELSSILEQRKAAQAAQTANAATEKAKAASSSVKSTPVTVGKDGPGDSIRAHLEAAFAARR